MKIFSKAWRATSNASTAFWLFQLIPSGLAGTVIAFLAAGSRWSAPAIALAALGGFAISLVIANYAPAVWARVTGPRFPQRHAAILQELANDLSQLKGLAITYLTNPR